MNIQVLMSISILAIYFAKNAVTWPNFIFEIGTPKCKNPPNIIQFSVMEIYG